MSSGPHHTETIRDFTHTHTHTHTSPLRQIPADAPPGFGLLEPLSVVIITGQPFYSTLREQLRQLVADKLSAVRPARCVLLCVCVVLAVCVCGAGFCVVLVCVCVCVCACVCI